MNNPIQLLKNWLDNESELGAPNSQQAVLCTATPDAIPHGRVVAIREISTEGLLFFTQKTTRKVAELIHHQQASIVFWLELQQRQVVVEGKAEALTVSENLYFWESYPREAQLRFYAYAQTSAQAIASKAELENKKQLIASEYQDQPLPIHPHYQGFRLKPNRFVFYHYRTDELSDVIEYQYTSNAWARQLLSP